MRHSGTDWHAPLDPHNQWHLVGVGIVSWLPPRDLGDVLVAKDLQATSEARAGEGGQDPGKGKASYSVPRVCKSRCASGTCFERSCAPDTVTWATSRNTGRCPEVLAAAPTREVGHQQEGAQHAWRSGLGSSPIRRGGPLPRLGINSWQRS